MSCLLYGKYASFSAFVETDLSSMNYLDLDFNI